MKKLKSKFASLLALMIISIAVTAQTTQAIGNDCLACRDLNSGIEVTGSSDMLGIQKLKMELSQLHIELKALEEKLSKDAGSNI